MSFLRSEAILFRVAREGALLSASRREMNSADWGSGLNNQQIGKNKCKDFIHTLDILSNMPIIRS